MRIYFFNMLTCTYVNKRIDSVSSELLILEKKRTIANQWFGGLLCFWCKKLWMLQPRKTPGQTWDTSWRCRSHRTAAGQGWPGSTCGRRRAHDAPESGCAQLWQFVPLHPFPFSAIFWTHLCDKFFLTADVFVVGIYSALLCEPCRGVSSSVSLEISPAPSKLAKTNQA